MPNNTDGTTPCTMGISLLHTLALSGWEGKRAQHAHVYISTAKHMFKQQWEGNTFMYSRAHKHAYSLA